MNTTKPVIVIGAGPVGIAAAAHLHARGIAPLVLEKGNSAGSSMLEWGHVSVFTAWKNVVDKAVVGLLGNSNWQMPDEDKLPTGREIVEQYLQPAAATPELKNAIIYNAEVIGVSKQAHSKSSSTARDEADFTVHYKTPDNEHHVLHSESVIDASGTWYNPNPIGLDGLPVPGESQNQDTIAYGIPDIANADRAQYEGKRTLVLGGGHSAINVILEMMTLRAANPDTKIYWGMRSNKLDKLTGSGINKRLPARAKLGIAAKEAIEAGELEVLVPLQVSRIEKTDSGLLLDILVDGEQNTIEVDRIVVSNGFRPDLSILREIRLDIDEIVEAPTKLAPLIDPNIHSCGSVKPHGVGELSHFDKNFYVVGIKAYGRAPSFLMLTGYEQVRSIAAELAGDHDAALNVELVLPSQKEVEKDQDIPPLVSGACCPTPAERQAASCCG
ncbi:MAG: NAD(P)-binding domain-containing protein [Symploca sp. SIO1A3]|nr:NAD(P)-binding domain-containing protein [Symploca sp. SIO1A3]